MFAPGFASLAAGPAATTVAYGCGPGYTPGHYGDCCPMDRSYGYDGPRRTDGSYDSRYGFGVPAVRIGPYGAGFSID